MTTHHFGNLEGSLLRQGPGNGFAFDTKDRHIANFRRLNFYAVDERSGSPRVVTDQLVTSAHDRSVARH
jgi:hypothetical protein